MHSWSTFGAWMSHGQTWTNHDSGLKKATNFPLIVFSMPSHGACTQMSFCLRSLDKFSKIEIPKTLKTHNFMCKPLIEMKCKEDL